MSIADLFAEKPLPRRLGLFEGLRFLMVDTPREFAYLATAAAFEKVVQISSAEMPGEDDDFHTALVFTTPEQALDRLTVLKPYMVVDSPIWVVVRKEMAWDTRAIAKTTLKTGLLDIASEQMGFGWVAHKLLVPRAIRKHR
jgi:hypothetical protein